MLLLILLQRSRPPFRQALPTLGEHKSVFVSQLKLAESAKKSQANLLYFDFQEAILSSAVNGYAMGSRAIDAF